MKTGNLLAMMMFVFPLILASCGINELDGNAVMHDYRVQNVFYAKDSKLKNISYVESVKSNKGGSIFAEYEYDNLGRMCKVSHPMYDNGSIIGVINYEAYVYNAKNQLEEIEYYNNNLYAGFIILRTHKYSFDNDGNKIKEVIGYPQITQGRIDSTLYFYNDNRLIRENKYEDGYFGREPWRSELITYIVYEYDNQGQLVKESTYSGTDNALICYSIHSYQNGLNVKTEVFVYNNVIGKTPLREIRRYYDRNDNLIYLESNELSLFSSTIGYVAKYEYYDK